MSWSSVIAAIGNAGVSPQGRPIEPMAGSPETVESLGDGMVQAGQEMVTAAQTLLDIQANQLAGGAMAGHAVEALREAIGLSVHTLIQAGELYEPVGAALRTYGSSVIQPKARADGQSESCEELWKSYLALPGDKDGPMDPDSVTLGLITIPADSPYAQHVAENNQAKQEAYAAWEQAATQWDAAYDDWQAAYDAALAGVREGTGGSIKDDWFKKSEGHLTEDRSGDPLYPGGEPAIGDINQGAFGNCWMLSVLAGQAAADPSKIEDMITANGDGTYTVRFADGEEVTVNETALLDHGPIDQGKWVSIIETAYARREGSFDAIDGGNSANAMEALFGYDVEKFNPHDGWNIPFLNRMSPEDSYQEMADALADNRPVSMSIRGELGLTGGHSFTLTDLLEIDGTRYVELRNPWASHGQMADPIEAAGGILVDNDGVFLLPLDVFADHVSQVQVAQ